MNSRKKNDLTRTLVLERTEFGERKLPLGSETSRTVYKNLVSVSAEHRFRVFENVVLMKIFSLRMSFQKEWRILRQAEFQNW
jgi:hypothetical protein